jgi:uncharacterized cupredoxin-like copper-binding protein
VKPGSTIIAIVTVALVAITVPLIAVNLDDDTSADSVREYDLEIKAADIDYGDGNVWHAWTFNGTVPGPVIEATVGEKIVVNVKNNLNLVHSFHTHLTGYDQESDGSQTNIISGVGSGAMVPPNGEYTYEFEATEPGIYYYHCHSADGGLMISQHIHQGLYGAIVVHEKNEKNVREEVIFMGETGHETEGANVPTYIMNGLGLPGGEHVLEEAYLDGGFEAVAAQLNKTVPAYNAEVGEEMRVHLINIGDQMHTFHAHNVDHISELALGGKMWPANVVPLLPGAADTISLTFDEPGFWLFHCHVVNHADAGMIGLFVIVEEGKDSPPAPPTRTAGEPPTAPRATSSPSPPPAGPPAGAALTVEGREFGLTVDRASVPAGDTGVTFDNAGSIPHELAILRTDDDPAELPESGGIVDEEAAGDVVGRINQIPGGSSDERNFNLAPGAYVLICNVPGHYRAGMYAPLTVQ